MSNFHVRFRVSRKGQLEQEIKTSFYQKVNFFSDTQVKLSFALFTAQADSTFIN